MEEHLLDNKDAFTFIEEYFSVLFKERKLEKLNDYLHQEYWDDDIGASGIDHIENGKQYLTQLFERKPKVGVIVKSAMICDNVITAYLEWYNDVTEMKSLWLKGIGLFVMDSGKIRKRHTFIYQKNE